MTLPDPRTAWYVVEWIVRIGALAVVPLRRSPAATASWLLLIFFLPVPGLALFLMIGHPHFPAWRQKKSKALHPYFADIAARIEAEAPPGECGEIAGFAHRLGRLPASGGNAVELIDHYDDVVDRLVGDIDAAAVRIDILVYIFADDVVGRRIAAALGRARTRGVAVRVMFDPVGSHHWRRGTLKLLRGVGVEAQEALPVRWFWRRTRSDMRNHRKLFVIDGRIGYAGSQNLVAKDFRPGVVNRELVARVTGPAVASLMAVVAGDWSLETEQEPDDVTIPDAVGHARVQLLPSGADYPLEGFETLLVWQLHRACDRVVLVTPYFIPDEAVLAAMRSAAARGVAVDLIVSAVIDQHVVHLAQCSYYDALLSAGVRIHLFRDFLLHAKNVCVDSRLGIVGSSNVDLRSFQLNEEASLLLYDGDTIGVLERIQEGYLDGSDCVDLMTWRARPKVRRLIENIARIMSPLL